MPADGHRLWSGTVSFGLVSVPVALVSAVRPRRSAFHLLHRADNARLRRLMFCPNEGEVIPPDHVVRGFEVEEGRHVIVDDDEIRAIAPKRSTTIEIQEFVPTDQIAPAFYDRPYYLLPTGADKPYRLLVATLAETGRSGLAEVVLHGREHLVALQAVDDVLCLLTLRYPAELRTFEGVDAEPDAADVRRIGTAIESSSGSFEPGLLVDEYQKRVDRLIRRKRKQGETVEAPEVERAADGAAEGEEVDLIAALEESLAEAKQVH